MAHADLSPREIRFGNPSLQGVGVELLHLQSLKTRVSAQHLSSPQRAGFFMLLLVTEGFLRHTVDFIELRLGVGSLVFVRPGQVQQWQLDLPVQGCMVMIDPPALSPVPEGRAPHDSLLTAMEDWPVGVRLDEDFAADLAQALQRLDRDLREHDGSANDVLLIRHQLLGVMLRVARWHRQRWQEVPPAEVGPREVHVLFRRALEQGFRTQRGVAAYARRLGFSESTLNRACQTAAGQSAKVLIDRRVALEAARMLVHGRASVAEVGHALGFSEPTNFVRFFSRMVGMTPARFRQQQMPLGAQPEKTG